MRTTDQFLAFPPAPTSRQPRPGSPGSPVSLDSHWHAHWQDPSGGRERVRSDRSPLARPDRTTSCRRSCCCFTFSFIGTFVLVTVAAGSGVINDHVGDTPVTRAAAVIAPGAVVMAMNYAWGPLSLLHINPAVTFAFACRMVFPTAWVVSYGVAQAAAPRRAAADRQHDHVAPRLVPADLPADALVMSCGPGAESAGIRLRCLARRPVVDPPCGEANRVAQSLATELVPRRR
ncbi:MAG: aquaporin [Streptosporangiaceae bacterium]